MVAKITQLHFCPGIKGSSSCLFKSSLNEEQNGTFHIIIYYNSMNTPLASTLEFDDEFDFGLCHGPYCFYRTCRYTSCRIGA